MSPPTVKVPCLRTCHNDMYEDDFVEFNTIFLGICMNLNVELYQSKVSIEKQLYKNYM